MNSNRAHQTPTEVAEVTLAAVKGENKNLMKKQKVIMMSPVFVSMIALFTIAILATEQQQVQAEKSPYDSGHSHGCSDAHKDVDDRYIIDHPADEHTNEFMHGYNNGYDSCSGSGGGSDEGTESNNNDQSQSQSQSQSNNNENNNNSCVPGATCYFN